MLSEMSHIDPMRKYNIGEAAKLVGVCTVTLRKDARQGYIRYTVSEKGRMKFGGKDLIRYRDYVI